MEAKLINIHEYFLITEAHITPLSDKSLMRMHQLRFLKQFNSYGRNNDDNINNNFVVENERKLLCLFMYCCVSVYNKIYTPL